MKTSTRRAAAVTAAVVALAPAAAFTAAPARADVVAAPTTANRAVAAAAANYLVTTADDAKTAATLKAGDYADLVVALAASGTQQQKTLAYEALAQSKAKAYVTSAGAAGKLAIAAGTMGDDATRFGGVNLVKVITDAAVKDPSLGGAFTASLAVLGLSRSHVAVPQDVVDTLLAGQQASGAFGYTYGGAFTEDPDTTAMVVQALASLPATPRTTTAITKALAWADAHMTNATYWDGYSPANTTGLMVAAYQAAGRTKLVARTWLLAQQKVAGGTGWANTLNGKSPNVLATVQALPAAAGSSYATVGYRPLATNQAGESTGDAIADVFGVDASGTLQFYKGHAGAPLTWVGARATGFGSMTYMAQIKDPSGTGRSDLLVRTAGNALVLYRGTGMGYVTAGPQFGKNWGGMTQIVPVGSLDGGKTQYVVARRGDGVLFRYTITATGLSGIKAIGRNWNGMKQLIGVGDFTKDGRDDLLAVRTDGTLWAYAGKADGTIGAARNVGHGWAGFTAVFAPGDLSGNRTRDLAGVNAKGTMYAYDNLNGAWSPARVIATGVTGKLYA